MMHLLFGHLATWLLLGVAWLVIAIFVAVTFVTIARMGGKDEGK